MQIEVKSERLTELVSAAKAMADAIGEYDLAKMHALPFQRALVSEAFAKMLAARKRFVKVSRGGL